MQLYSVYSDGFNKANEAYHQRLKTSKLFAELISIIEVVPKQCKEPYNLSISYNFWPYSIQSNPASKGLKVPSFMIHPVQRIPRYELLLKGVFNIWNMYVMEIAIVFLCVEYVKHLPKDHPDLVNAKGNNIWLLYTWSNKICLFFFTWQLLWHPYRELSSTWTRG